MEEGRTGVEVGDVVGGRWRLTGRLGQGGFGMVYKAEDTSALGLGEAAIKVLHPRTSPAERAAFHDEIRKIVALRHPNLVAYLDSGEFHDGVGQAHLYLVTELCRYSLAGYLAGPPSMVLTAEQGERLLADLAAGLAHIHSRGLLHRDLKPANVMLGGDDWKLGDFGLTRQMSDTGHYHHGDVLMGTPRFMAPELFESSSASPAADVYALGGTFHQALTGRFVHNASSDVGLVVAVTTTPPSIDPSLPPHWRQLIERCLARDPAQRPPAARLAALLAELRLRPPAPIVVSPPGSGSPATVPTYQSEPSSPQPVANPFGPGPGGPGPGVTGRGPGGPGAGGADQGGRGPVDSRPQPARRRLSGPMSGLVAGLAVILLGGLVWLGTSLAGGRPGGGDGGGGGPTSSALVDRDDAASAKIRVDKLIPQLEDRPAGFDATADPVSDDEFCTGVPTPRVAFPGLAGKAVEFSNSTVTQLFRVRVIVYASATDAQAELAYFTKLVDRCNGQPTGATSGKIWRLTPQTLVPVRGAEEQSVMIQEQLGAGSPAVGSLAVYARIGNVVVVSTGTDRNTTVYYAELVAAKANGAFPPPKVEPSGPVGGVTSATAGQVRAVLAAQGDKVSPGVTAWLASHPDTDIDTVEGGACADMAGATTAAEASSKLGGAWEALSKPVRGNLTRVDHAQLVGAGIVFYCPDRAALFQPGG